MNNTKIAVSNATNTDELNALIIDAIQDIKGKNLIKIDLRDLDEAPSDFFIICEGESSTQVSAIANNVYKKIKDQLGYIPHREGQETGNWVLVDYFDTIVHVFYPEARALYDLEDLWSDAKFTKYEDL